MGGSVPSSNTCGRYNRKVLENAKYFSPDMKGILIRSKNSWEGKSSSNRQNKSGEFIENIEVDFNLPEEEYKSYLGLVRCQRR